MARTPRTKRSRPRPTRRQQRLSFAAIEIVGGLLTPDVFNQIASPEGDAKTERDYGVPEGLDLRDEIARAYRMADRQWAGFDAAKDGNLSLPARFMPQFMEALFGFDDIGPVGTARMGEREFPIGHAAREGRIPVVIAPVPGEDQRRSGLDTPQQAFADGNRRRSATLLLQEYLNAKEECLWGIATDGLTLRLLRDNLSLTRPAWIEIDLAKIFRDGLYADFSAVWLLIHASRFGPAGAAPSDSALERWREEGQQGGVVARDMLRHGVEAALLQLGQGAIKHPDNTALREALAAGSLTSQGLYEELLSTAYRLIFLFAAEDRDLLHAPGASANQRAAYARGYGVSRLRERAMRRATWDRHHDAWDGLRAIFQALATGAPALGLPALGGLFEQDRTPHLDGVRIGNRYVMEAIFRLAWLSPQGQPLRRVNWRDMRTEELGSVYEGLLELIPEASAEHGSFAFRDTDGAAGSERKSTGSYYTPDALVKLVLDKTLDPLLDRAQAAGGDDPASAILELNILDPACGSGHFLLGAAHRAAARIANLRSPGAPGRDDYQHALREVISHMIHGVDRNPMAVELCKVALWIEALEPGQPLSFLDARILCGDSLVGIQDLESLKGGIPDEAYSVLTGDDKAAARTYKRWNKEQREGSAATGMLEALRPPTEMLDEARAAADMPEDSVAAIKAKRRAFERLFTGKGWVRRKRACDLYVSAFFSPKAPLPDAVTPAESERIALERPTVPLTGHVWVAARDEQIYGPLVGGAESLCQELKVFHWPLAFSAVFARGGFDAVIGNPPWERIKLQEKEFFAGPAPEIANARNAAERGRMIRALGEAEEGSAERRLFTDFQATKRMAEAASAFARCGVRYPLTGTGDVNTYALFAEAFATLIRSEGRAGVIVPTGIATDSSTAAFFGDLVERHALKSLVSFYEVRGWFKGTDDRKPFCIICIAPGTETAQFSFGIKGIPDLEHAERKYFLTPEQIARINPNTKTAPIFRARADAELTAAIYDRVPVLIEERPNEDGGDINPWGVVFQRMFDMSNDSTLFRTTGELIDAGWQRDGTAWVSRNEAKRVVPLYEAKMIHHFDHRWATYASADARDEEGTRDVTLDEKTDPGFEPTPRYWLPETEVRLRAARVSPGLKRAVREEDATKVLKAMAEHVAAAWPDAHGRAAIGEDITRVVGRGKAWQDALGGSLDQWLVRPATLNTLAALQRRVALSEDDLRALADGPPEVLEKAQLLIDRKQPRWLMGWRDIALHSVERTMIASVFPNVGVGDKLLLVHHTKTAFAAVTFLGLISSLSLDYIVRQKFGGTSLKYHFVKQFPVIAPDLFSRLDLDFIMPRVLELTYTSHTMCQWAKDLGYAGPPFDWDPDRRMQLRAELDGFFARKYGLSRADLRYVLDPTDVYGPDYPSETFRVLRDKEIARFGEYRTQRLVLEAYDELEGVG
jgi:hypothetical protein